MHMVHFTFLCLLESNFALHFKQLTADSGTLSSCPSTNTELSFLRPNRGELLAECGRGSVRLINDWPTDSLRVRAKDGTMSGIIWPKGCSSELSIALGPSPGGGGMSLGTRFFKSTKAKKKRGKKTQLSFFFFAPYLHRH
jgi:hypothetical protein